MFLPVMWSMEGLEFMAARGVSPVVTVDAVGLDGIISTFKNKQLIRVNQVSVKYRLDSSIAGSTVLVDDG